ncbi:hypothetical protein M407DRAFT_35128 [Tulasnella calospora MUT 4182]|uniref:Uncharacterized protein n=1 Tax=Tulasnella calospora MUT 4182 TaxID=1051891 RepID=A0A0C3L0Q4_9AGAM|nr:hypothetical protein M407DRAFT_35128 [Tulasnella calospora MUT 4182]
MWHLGQSLYQLETLCIDVGPLARGETPGTSTSLISILQSFPRIKRLETCISCDSIPLVAETEAHSSLEVLDLSWSPAPKVRQEEVVGFLKSILPRTARVFYMGEKGSYGVDAGKAAWAEVARLMEEA